MALFDYQPEDPAIHHAAARLAQRLVGRIAAAMPDPAAQQQALTVSDSEIRLGLREFRRQVMQENGRAR